MYLIVVLHNIVLSVSLAYFLWIRWVFTHTTIGFMLCEMSILLIGWWNVCVLVAGTVSRFFNELQLKKIMFENLTDVPHVLIIIPTYNESVDVLQRTLEHVRRVRYPTTKKTVVIGDDGRRNSIQHFVQERFPEFIYHTRRCIRGHAKAGNLNDVLTSTNTHRQRLYEGSLVLILDCDMAPSPDILENMVPYFYDISDEGVHKNNRCAFVQSPQQFCNIRGIDFLGQHYRFFYEVVMRAYSGFQQGVPCCGTNVIFDRDILQSIGGIQYGSVTEDFNTSMRLHAEGYISRYYPHRTATGLSPMSLVDFFHQRQRWTVGGLQIVCTTPSYRRAFWKLPWIHRWIYGFSGASCITSLIMTVLLISPFLDLFGISFFLSDMPVRTYIYFFLPYATLYTLSLLWLMSHMHISTFIVTVFESIFMVPYQLYYCVHFLGRYFLGFQHIRFRSSGRQNIRFTITPKTETSIELSKIFFTGLLLSPFLVYIGLGGYCFWEARHNLRKYTLDLWWMSLIMAQFSPPVLYVLQNMIPAVRWRTSSEVVEEQTV